MARPIGKPGVAECITITVHQDWVVSTQKNRYVFVDTFLSGIRRLSLTRYGSLALYRRVVQTLKRNLYNTVTIYGLQAINIDDPQHVIVSAWLKFVVVKTEKELESCKLDIVRKKDI